MNSEYKRLCVSQSRDTDEKKTLANSRSVNEILHSKISIKKNEQDCIMRRDFLDSLDQRPRQMNSDIRECNVDRDSQQQEGTGRFKREQYG